MIISTTAVGGLFALLLSLADAGTSFRGLANSENDQEVNDRYADARRLNLVTENNSEVGVELATAAAAADDCTMDFVTKSGAVFLPGVQKKTLEGHVFSYVVAGGNTNDLSQIIMGDHTVVLKEYKSIGRTMTNTLMKTRAIYKRTTVTLPGVTSASAVDSVSITRVSGSTQRKGTLAVRVNCQGEDLMWLQATPSTREVSTKGLGNKGSIFLYNPAHAVKVSFASTVTTANCPSCDDNVPVTMRLRNGDSYSAAAKGERLSCGSADLTVDQCKAATLKEGKKFNSVSSWPNHPKGCICNQGNWCYFNTHATGAVHSNTYLLCPTRFCDAPVSQAITMKKNTEKEHSMYLSCNRLDVPVSKRFHANAVVQVVALASNGNSGSKRTSTHRNKFFDDGKGITVYRPDYRTVTTQSLIAPTWKDHQYTVAWEPHALTEDNKGDFYHAYERASVLGLSVVLDSLPVAFCWKDGVDWGTPPNGCNGDNWHKHEQMCYKDCRSGYAKDPVAGACWESCRNGYTNHGLTCFKNLWDIYWKKTYVTDQATMFSNRASCPSHKKKVAALCYYDCSKISSENVAFSNLVDCGTGACSYAEDACYGEIVDMALETAKGLFVFASFQTKMTGMGVPFGKTQFMQLANTQFGGFAIFGMWGKVQNAWTVVKRKFLSSQYRETLHENIIANIRKPPPAGLDPALVSILGEDGMERVASAVIDRYYELTDRRADQISRSPLVFADSLGLVDLAEKCNYQSTTNEKIACADAAMEFIDFIDPTGLSSIASAFLKPVCDFD